jgi:aspartate carbamoyltransferase catalytic subunit
MVTEKLHHVVSAEQFTPEFITSLFRRAQEMRRGVGQGACPPTLRGKIMAAVFYEPSTRTRLSFEAAMHRLGGAVIGTESAGHFSSATKGETLEDSIRVISGYVNAIVLRHSERGASARAAGVSSVPLINAGDGDGEHPTQALLDLFNIAEDGNPGGKHVVFVGDLLKGRTVHSLSRLLHATDARMSFISPASLRLPQELRSKLAMKGLGICEKERIDDVIASADVVYMTRVQKERLAEIDGVALDGSGYCLTPELVAQMKPDAIIMHPLPRNNEIPTSVDADPRAAYFRQAQNGLYVRMALLEYLLA